MNRIDSTLQELKNKNEKALITFITAGDPNIETTEKLIYKMFDNGADIIEIGVPFSDPMAEGKVIQASSLRALSGGINLLKIFDMVKNIRIKTDKPLVLMMYINTIFKFGTERFFTMCKDTGIDGVIVPDLPYEEREEISEYANANGIININLVSPTSHERIKEIAGSCNNGFLYCVSSTGVTGTRNSFNTDFNKFFDDIKKYAKIPAMVGFGISSPKQAEEMSKYCDGVIVGSAIVKIISEYGEISAENVGFFTKSLKDALR